MTPKLDPALGLADVVTSCAKPGCSTWRMMQRHHMGCEFMFVRHFRRRRGTQRYDDFVVRYHEFHPDDVVRICRSHHREIHALYMPIIRRHVQRAGLPVRRWSWDMAEAMMHELREYCQHWLHEQTPGLR